MKILNKHKSCETILKRLLEIVYLYKRSSAYNYIPDTKEDGWDYFTIKFNDIAIELNQDLTLSKNEYDKINAITLEIKSFVRSFEGADSLSNRYFDANPNLRFFQIAYQIQEESDKLFYQIAAKNMLSYVPKIRDFSERDQYLKRKKKESQVNNYREDEEDLFMTELALALRVVFQNELSTGICKCGGA